MNLYLIEQDVNLGWDRYYSAVVAAETEEQARMIHPDGQKWNQERNEWGDTWTDYSWATPPYVKATMIGKASPGIDSGKVLCANFNAG